MGCDRAQLHLGHHRQSQGCRLSSSRRLPQRHRQRAGLEPAATSGLSLDLADVSLQRLVLSLDDHRPRRNPCLPAPRRGGRDLRGDRARLKARQGVRYPVLEGLMVADAKTLAPVPRDGATMGEVFMRGNIVMKGYLKNPAATREAFAGGWFHTGDLGV